MEVDSRGNDAGPCREAGDLSAEVKICTLELERFSTYNQRWKQAQCMLQCIM